MNPTFRQANTEHISEILVMMQDFYFIDNYAFDLELNQKNLIKLLESPDLGRVYIILVDDKIVGYIYLTFGFSFEYKGRDAFIDELYLKSAYRGQGLGKLAMDFVEQAAVEFGVNALHLEVERHNEKANRLYYSQGFTGKERYMLTKFIE